MLGRTDGALGWARYQRKTGDRKLAQERAKEALDLATDPRQPLALISIHRFLGELDTEEQHFAEAEEHLQESLSLADACLAPFERALTLLAFAELRVAQQRPDEARELLAEVRAICEPLKAKPTLERVDTLEAQLMRSARPNREELPAGLTPREVEVLGLVAQGLTDVQVAEKLYLSPRTVGSHLSAIYGKLDVNSRTAADSFRRRARPRLTDKSGVSYLFLSPLVPYRLSNFP